MLIISNIDAFLNIFLIKLGCNAYKSVKAGAVAPALRLIIKRAKEMKGEQNQVLYVLHRCELSTEHKR